jgi:hypothetical protein
MKRLAPIFLVPLGYATLSAILLLPSWNMWIKLHAWYFLSLPASHLFARETLLVQVLCGCIQYALLATIWVLLFRRHQPSD